MQSRAAAKEAASVELSCTLRTVRAGAEPWSNDPLPGSYYVRLTVVDLPEEDLGLPLRAAVEADVEEEGGAFAVDGALATPLVAGTVTGSLREPEDGWSGGWWSDRWLWTAAGGSARCPRGHLRVLPDARHGPPVPGAARRLIRRAGAPDPASRCA